MTGTVTDQSGAVVPLARVTLLNINNGIRATANSNESGIYVFPYMDPGPYSLTVEAKGFEHYARPRIILETGRVLSLDIALQVGDMSQTVTVTAQTPLLQADVSSASQVVENATVADMPMSSRNFANLVRLDGNVTFITENEAVGLVDVEIAGGRGRMVGWNFDGAFGAQNSLLSAPNALNPPVAAVQEFKVETAGVPAEIGRSTSGVLSVTTKSGTNQFHGEVYEFVRNNYFDARSFFAPSVAPRRYNVFGGTVGGPIKTDVTHFFFSYEGTRRRDGLTNTFSVPSPQQVQGDFSQAAGTLLDPTTGQPFPGKVIPKSTLDPVGAFFAALYPVPNVSGAAPGANNFRLNSAVRDVGNSYIVRVDHAFGPNDRIMGRYIDQRTHQDTPPVFPNAGADPAAYHYELDGRNGVATWFHSFRPNLFNELLFSYGQVPFSEIEWGAYATHLAGDAGLTGIALDGMPQIAVSGLTGLGRQGGVQVRTSGPERPQDTYQVTESVSWIRGKHSIKIGAEYRRSRMADYNEGTRSGSFTFNDVATGPSFGLASLLLGRPVSASVSALNLLITRSDYYAGYIQTDWKVTPDLTVNLGIRYDLDTPRWEENNQQDSFDPSAINPVSGTPGIVTFANRNGVSKYVSKFDKDNFSPRIGFAWRLLDRETVLRGAYALRYGPLYENSISSVVAGGFGDVRSFSSPDNGLTPAFLLRDGVPQVAAQALSPSFGAVPVGQKVVFSPDFIDPDQRNTYAHSIALSLQHQWKYALLSDVSYDATLAHRINGGAVNINETPPALRGATQNQLLRPFPQFGNVTKDTPDWGNSTYHSLNVRLEKRYSAGLNLLFNYTWGKFLDDVGAVLEAAGVQPTQSYYARHLDKSRSGNDIGQRAVASSVYDLPFGRNQRLHSNSAIVNQIVGGWSIGLICELRSGLPYAVVEQTNRLNAFSADQRANRIGDPVLPSNRSRAAEITEWFNTAAFTAPASGQLGNSPRFVASGPGYADLDTSMLREFHISERRFVQFRGEFFNLLNRANFGQPNGSQGSAAFGMISGTVNSGRYIQIGLRLVY